jgi:tripartite-type tricarboxylate transporter receptor subunit TctC
MGDFMTRLFAQLLVAMSPAFFVAPVAAQTWPGRTVSVVVPYPAGGSVDGVARIMAQKLHERIGQSFIVENRAGGAGGVVGANYVAKAPADGHTLMLTASIHVITPLLSKNMPYDVVRDFSPISLIATGPLIVSTTPSVAARNLKDFFAQVRSDPGKFTFATSGYGAAGHLAVELLKRDAGVDTLVIAYKGAGPMLTDVMSGQVQLVADPMLSSLPLAQSGKIKALAITSLKRVAAAPDIPTVAESGMTAFEFLSWYGLWGPHGLPTDIVARLQAEVAAIVTEPDVKARMSILGFEPVGSTTAHFAKFIDDEIAKYAKIIHDGNIKAE